MSRPMALAQMAIARPSPALVASNLPFDLGAFDPTTRRAAEYLLRPDLAFPVLPAAVAEVMALANSPEANFRDVDRVVRQDAVVAARVL